MPETIALADIDFGPAIAVRSRRDADTIEKYKDAYLELEDLPPIKLFRCGKKIFAGDGGHRGQGRGAAGLAEIDADVTDFGSVEEAERAAVACALKANEYHGLPRSKEDKRAAIRVALLRPEYADASDNKIADLCLVNKGTVHLERERMVANGELTGPGAERVAKYKPGAVIRGGAKSAGAGSTVPLHKSPPKGEPTDAELEQAGREIEAHRPIPYHYKPDPVLDAKGRPIPAALVPVFADRKWFKERAAGIAAELAAIKAGTGPAMAATFLNDIEARLTEARNALLSGEPYVVCPACGDLEPEPGEKPCGCCCGRRWIARGGFRLLNEGQRSIVAEWEADAKKGNSKFQPEDAAA